MELLKSEFISQDKRRTLTQLFTADVKQVNIYKAVYGAVLGDHYHKDTIEYFYIISGALKFNDLQIIKKGDLFVVYPPDNHILRVISDKSTFMTFLTKPYSKEDPDIWKK